MAPGQLDMVAGTQGGAGVVKIWSCFLSLEGPEVVPCETGGG